MRNVQDFADWLTEIIEKGTKIRVYEAGFSEYADSGQFFGWATQAEHYLMELLSSTNHTYYARFVGQVPKSASVFSSSLSACLQILRSLQDDLKKGRLISLQTLVTAEVFSDFLDMAEHLLKNDYKDASASLIGGVLERGLRDIASLNNLPVHDRDDLSALNNKLAEKGIFSRLVQRSLNVWIAIRNHADHGQFGEYSKENVRDMLSGVRLFLAQHQ